MGDPIGVCGELGAVFMGDPIGVCGELVRSSWEIQ